MLMSSAGRRLVHTTSALGLMGAVVALVCSIFIVATPTTASAAVTKSYTYSCQSGGPFAAATALTVSLSAPDTVTAGQSFTLTVTIPQLTLSPAATTTTEAQANLTLTPTGGTMSDTAAKSLGQVSQNQNTVPQKSITYQITPTSGVTSVAVRPGPLALSLTSAPNTPTSCTVSSTDALTIPVGTGGGGGTGGEVVTYNCKLANNATDTDYPAAGAQVDIAVNLSTPSNVTASANATITWSGTVEATGDPLVVPTNFPTSGGKLFATIKPTGAGAPTTAAGEATLGAVTVGQDFPALPNVIITVKPTTAGTVTMYPGDLALGTSSSSYVLKCTAPTTGLKAYSFTVASATSTSTSSNSPSPTTTTPRPTTTRTSTVTITPSRSTTTRKSTTPKAGADTGAGGTMGPDGRLFILTGTALVGAAAVGGLVMRRRSIKG
ncbi:hypothetical protein ACU635_58655 [[Actinomadura] parvosata]|uniref:hypothetical protein n=1 Tax=[Actinomadura] parvosata TaxID=1955412 RepID=UPI00406C50AD